MCSITDGFAEPTYTSGAVSGPCGNDEGGNGMADSRTMSVLPGPNAGSPSTRTSHDNGSHSDALPSCLKVCVATLAIPAAFSCAAAQSIVAALDGKPVTRPQICPEPISRCVRLRVE